MFSELNRYLWRAARAAEIAWEHPWKPKPSGRWAVVRGCQAEGGGMEPGTEEIVLTTPTRVLAEEIALLMRQSFYDGRLQERAWWESRDRCPHGVSAERCFSCEAQAAVR